MTEVAQPSPGQDPPAPAVSGPWANAVTQTFADPAVQAQVDQFMRTHYQPYVTRLENERAAAQQAQQFYDAFQEDAGAAFLSLAEEMFGEEAVDGIVAALGDGESTELNEALETAQETPVAQLSPEQQQLLDWAAQQKVAQENAERQAQYEADKKAWLAGDEARKEIDPALFDPFLAAHDGDFEKAAAHYEQFQGRFKPADPNPDPAPATLPGSAPTPATTEDFGGSFDAAWESFAAEQRALKPAPPTV